VTLRLLAATLCASLLAATSLPCPPDAAVQPPPARASGDHATAHDHHASAHGHHGSATADAHAHHGAATGHGEADGRKLAAPCTCGCEDAPEARGNGYSRIGHALRSALRDAAPAIRVWRIATTASSMPAAPHTPIDPIPI